MMGDHAIYHDGWIASTKVMRPPWDIAGAESAWTPPSYPWELYDLRKDWTQSEDVAAKYPAKLKEMQKLFWQEAKKYQVLPLDATVATRLITPRPEHHGRPQRVHLDRRPLTGTPNGDAPSILNASYNFKAEVEIPQGGAEGMLITQGGRFGGYGFYVLKGKPVFLWNLVDLKRIRWEGPEALSPGKHTLEFDFKYDGLGMGTLAFNNMSGIGRRGTGVLKVDGKEVATQKMEHTHSVHPAVGRELRRRLRHRHAGGRRGLPGAVQVHRQAQQADAHHRPAEAVARGHQETGSGKAEQQGERVVQY